MILLTSTSDLLKVVTSGTANIDVHASYVDLAAGVVTPGRQNTAISSATTTTIVASPAASTYRTVKSVFIRNKHASTSNDVTVTHTDSGALTVEFIKVTLPAGHILHYDEGSGWEILDSFGRTLQNSSQNGSNAAVNALNLVVLSADVINNNGTANTIADVTGLSFSVTAGEKYFFRATIQYTSAATATGSRWAMSGPAGTWRYRSQYSLTTTSDSFNNVGAADTPAASNATSANTNANIAVVEGFFEPSANGTVIVRFASEVLSSAITAKAGSILQWVRVI